LSSKQIGLGVARLREAIDAGEAHEHLRKKEAIREGMDQVDELYYFYTPAIQSLIWVEIHQYLEFFTDSRFH
jgi:hypothetical protein